MRYHNSVIIADWIIFSLFMFCFAWVTACNIIGPLRATPEHGYSMAPLVGGFCCAMGLMAVPMRISGWWWLLAFLDPGTTFLPFMLPAALWLSIKGPKKRD